ncbi:MAG TPA: hypothetical protein VN285_09020 [Candidatus Deferrimicrobium sp.]|nr:hypothetical protein [Candidatus Deferrimicrobium sp.]
MEVIQEKEQYETAEFAQSGVSNFIVTERAFGLRKAVAVPVPERLNWRDVLSNVIIPQFQTGIKSRAINADFLSIESTYGPWKQSMIRTLKKTLSEGYRAIEEVLAVYLIPLEGHYEIDAVITSKDFSTRDRIYELEQKVRGDFPTLCFRFKTTFSARPKPVPTNAIDCLRD